MTILNILPIPAHQLIMEEVDSGRTRSVYNLGFVNVNLDHTISLHFYVDSIDSLASEFSLPSKGLFYLLGLRKFNDSEYVHIARHVDSGMVYSILTSKLTQLPPTYIV